MNNSKYKLSRYNYLFSSNGESGESKFMIYNSLSNGLAQLDKENYELLKSGEAGLGVLENDSEKSDVLQSMLKGNFIVEKEFDEVEFLRTKFNISKFGQKVLSLTIVPTMDCNLNCVYCYEVRKSVYMDEPTVNAIVEFTKNQIDTIGYRAVQVTWYGGEPLLNLPAIYSLSKKLIKLCKKKEIGYQAMVVTNGTFLTKRVVKKLKSYKVTHFQVTIDGTKEVHDVRRPFKVGHESSYETIVVNVDRVIGMLPIHIRVNVDKTNFSNTFELLEELEKRGWFEPSKNCFLYIGYTREWTSVCSNIAKDCFSMKEFSQSEIDFQRALISKGYKLGNLYPMQTSYCVAASPCGFAIDAKGGLFKCWADVGNKEALIGNVKDDNNLEVNNELLKWLSYDPLSQIPKCQSCHYFPICAGGCPYVNIKQKDQLKNNYNCTPWKILMSEKMQLFLEQQTNV